VVKLTAIMNAPNGAASGSEVSDQQGPAPHEHVRALRKLEPRLCDFTDDQIIDALWMLLIHVAPSLKNKQAWRPNEAMREHVHEFLLIVAPDDQISTSGSAHAYVEDLMGVRFMHTKIDGACALRAFTRISPLGAARAA